MVVVAMVGTMVMRGDGGGGDDRSGDGGDGGDDGGGDRGWGWVEKSPELDWLRWGRWELQVVVAVAVAVVVVVVVVVAAGAGGYRGSQTRFRIEGVGPEFYGWRSREHTHETAHMGAQRKRSLEEHPLAPTSFCEFAQSKCTV